MRPSLLIIILAFVFNQNIYAQLSGNWRTSEGNHVELTKTDYGFSFFDIKGEEPIKVTRVSDSSCERRFYDTDGKLTLRNYYTSAALITVTNGIDGRLISKWIRIADKEGATTTEPSYSIDSKTENQINGDNDAMIRLLESKIRILEERIGNSIWGFKEKENAAAADLIEISQDTEQSYALLMDNYYRQISSLQQQIDRLRL